MLLKTQVIRGTPGLFSLMIFAWLGVGVDMAFAQASNYLETLQEEASGLKLDRGTRVLQENTTVTQPATPASTRPKIDTSGGIEGLQPGLTAEQFELFLKNNYMGSYLFYRRMSEPNRAEVYQYYLENPDPSLIRQRILQISKK